VQRVNFGDEPDTYTVVGDATELDLDAVVATLSSEPGNGPDGNPASTHL
jgi:hypothetical protein